MMTYLRRVWKQRPNLREMAAFVLALVALHFLTPVPVLMVAAFFVVLMAGVMVYLDRQAERQADG